MSIFYPNLLVDKITDINIDILSELNIKNILLDIDDTISPGSTVSISDEIDEWLKMLKSHFINLAIISNNSRERVECFSQKLHIPYVCRSMKPLPFGVYKAMDLISANKSTVAIVGDQIFTDILAAKFVGIKSILVEPLSMDGSFTLKIKRGLEYLVKKLNKERLDKRILKVKR